MAVGGAIVRDNSGTQKAINQENSLYEFVYKNENLAGLIK